MLYLPDSFMAARTAVINLNNLSTTMGSAKKPRQGFWLHRGRGGVFSRRLIGSSGDSRTDCEELVSKLSDAILGERLSAEGAKTVGGIYDDLDHRLQQRR